MTTLNLEESRRLLDLCRSGRLYEIEEWTKHGKSIRFLGGLRKTSIQIVLETGFYSLAELFLRNEQDVELKNAALAQAVGLRRLDFIELLVTHGAETSSVPLTDVLRAWDPKIIRFFLDRGTDIVAGRPFVTAFCDRVRPALRAFKEYKESQPAFARELDQQAERALRYFTYEGNLKWVSLMLWAGADPRAKGPRPNSHFENDPECDSTAIEDACIFGNLDVLRRFHLSPETDDLSHLLNEAACFAHVDVIRYLLTLGARTNGKSNGGSLALEHCLLNLEYDGRDHKSYGRRVIRRDSVYRTMEAVTVLLESGALWRPDDSASIQRFRRTLRKAEPDLVTDLFMLLKRHGACTSAAIAEFLTTPAMRRRLAGKDWHLTRFGTGRGRPGKRPHASRSRTPLRLLAQYDRELLYSEVWSQPIS
jgi:hypothetical protein